jgi:acetyl/propionyl-CoA carboxylase alpha subunit
MKYTAIIDGERLEIDLIRADDGIIEAETAGEKYILNAKIVEPRVYWLQWKNRSLEISVIPTGDAYAVSVGGKRIEIEIIDARAALRKAAQHGQLGTVEVRAPMPGKVVKVLVSEGAPVEMNQGLLVIEAMKMQNEIKSPKKGTVRKVGVRETEAVNAGDLLVVVE